MKIGDTTVARGSVEIEWCAQSRVAIVRYAPDTSLTAPDGKFLVDSLNGWIGSEGEPLAVLAFAGEVRDTDAGYRAIASGFFRQHRATVRLALVDAGAIVTVVSEMFRVATGIQLKGFKDEGAARAWLATS